MSIIRPNEYYDGTITISREMLSYLIDAAGLLASGSRIDKQYRERWQKLADEAQTLMDAKTEVAKA